MGNYNPAACRQSAKRLTGSNYLCRLNTMYMLYCCILILIVWFYRASYHIILVAKYQIMIFSYRQNNYSFLYIIHSSLIPYDDSFIYYLGFHFSRNLSPQMNIEETAAKYLNC